LLSFFDEDELEELYELTESEGMRGLIDVIDSILNEGNIMFQQFKEKTEEADLIFITGVGTAHPFLRSSQLLKIVSSKVYKKPIILIYPGEFTGLRLKLFGILDYEDDYQLSRISSGGKGMQIKELFKKDIFRTINNVVQAYQVDEEAVKKEIDEYVLT